MTRNKAEKKASRVWASLEGAQVDRCAEQNCSLLVKKGEARIIKCSKLNGDSAARSMSPMADYLVLSRSKNRIIGVIELKSGVFKVGKARSQLENGVRIALQIIKDVPGCSDGRVLVILTRRRFLHRIDEQRLSQPICVNGLKCTIHTRKCGSSLADALKVTPCSR